MMNIHNIYPRRHCFVLENVPERKMETNLHDQTMNHNRSGASHKVRNHLFLTFYTTKVLVPVGSRTLIINDTNLINIKLSATVTYTYNLKFIHYLCARRREDNIEKDREDDVFSSSYLYNICPRDVFHLEICKDTLKNRRTKHHNAIVIRGEIFSLEMFYEIKYIFLKKHVLNTPTLSNHDRILKGHFWQTAVHAIRYNVVLQLDWFAGCPLGSSRGRSNVNVNVPKYNIVVVDIDMTVFFKILINVLVGLLYYQVDQTIAVYFKTMKHVLELNKFNVTALFIFLFPVVIKIINTAVCQTCSILELCMKALLFINFIFFINNLIVYKICNNIKENWVHASLIAILAFVKPTPPGPPRSASVVVAGRTSAISGSGMPFMDDVLLWCPEAETKIDDFTECLGNEVSSLGELLQSEISSELDNALDGGGASVQDGGEHSGDDDIFKQLSDSSALLEQFFDFVNCDIKEENNNNVMSTGNKNHAAVALLQELQRTNAGKKFNITSANPLLAEKLLNPVSQLNPSLNQNSDMFINQNKFIKTEPSINDTVSKLMRRALMLNE
ncbi:hypothetical protein QTP88_005141 [Uroleucon formosanum]